MEFHVHTVPGHEGERLFSMWWPASQPRGTLVWVHGYAEHSGRYEKVVQFLLEKGWNSLLWDLRGHGRSTGKRGFVTEVEEYLYDLTAVWTHWKSRVKAPVVLFGHSLGGLLALRYRQLYSEIWEPTATLISAPLIQLRLEVPAWKRSLGQVAARLFPTLTLPSGLEPAQLTHDPEEARAYAQDPLVFKTVTAGWFAAVERAQIALWRDLPRLVRGKYLFLLPEADPICDTSTARKFYEQLPAPEKQLRLYPDSYHEPLHETCRTQVYQDIAAYLETL